MAPWPVPALSPWERDARADLVRGSGEDSLLGAHRLGRLLGDAFCGYLPLMRNRRLKRSTLPSVSTMRCSPVKNGWHSLQISTCSSGLVEPVVYDLPHEQVTVALG